MPYSSDFPGIYIHIPFCERKCRYCDFFSVTDLTLIPDVVSGLLREIRQRRRFVSLADTVYIGGGTPSVLSPGHISKILEAVCSVFTIAADAEITIEANPKTVRLTTLRQYRSMGINRINIGVQSFQDSFLKVLGRIHSGQDAKESIGWAKEAGFANIGADLICGIPGQTEEDWLSDLHQAAALHPDHLSCYLLSYEPGTVLTEQAQKGIISPLNDRRIETLFRITPDVLSAAGYEQYEVSNYARSGAFRSRHNQKYWTFAPYLGLGPSAHSFDGISRCWNHRSVSVYIRDLEKGNLPISGSETLTEEQRIIEAVYLGLRTSGGVCFADFYSRFGKTFDALFGKTVGFLISEGFVKSDPARACLTRKGMRYLDSVSEMLVNDLVNTD